MSQPIDVPEFQTLNLLDYGTEQDIVDAALAYAQQQLPEWNPRTGNTEVVLIQALALMLAPEVMAIQMMPAQVLEQLMSLYGIVRDPGAPVSGQVTITVTDSAPTQIIPADTRLRLRLADTGETVDFLTNDAITIITTDTTQAVAEITAEYLGIVGGGTPAGTSLDVVDPLPFIESVTVNDGLTGGAGQEADTPYFARASATLSRLASTLVLPEHFQYAALTRPGVGRAKVFDLYNPATPGTTAAGHVTLAAADAAGQPLGGDTAAALEGWLTSQALASLTIHVIEPTYTTIDLAVTVRASFGMDPAQVEESVRSTLTRWLSPTTWDWSPAVSQNSIVGVIAAASGVREVVNVPAGFSLDGKAPLPALGDVTVTVIS
jgi:uncharacterized phage protein gp47/JayE